MPRGGVLKQEARVTEENNKKKGWQACETNDEKEHEQAK